MIKRHIFLSTLIGWTVCSCSLAVEQAPTPQRIISLAPNITEVIYALKLSDRLVGATEFCTYPEAAKKIPRVGGFGQFNFEKIVSLNPDLVLLHKEYDTEKKRLETLNIPYMETGSYYIADIYKMIHDIGIICGVKDKAEELVDRLIRETELLRNKASDHPAVLITFGSSAGTDIGQIHAFGSNCIHNELLEIAGGRNVIESKLPYSILSREAVIRLNPDIIIELAPRGQKSDDPSRAWKTLPNVTAVKNKQVYVLTGDYTCIPGPRFIRTLEDFTEIIGGKR